MTISSTKSTYLTPRASVASLPLLKFKPALKEKVWGGHKLEPILHLPPTPKKIGEAWLVWDGLGVAVGELQGRTLRELTQTYGATLLGTQSADAKEFPLLIKFLDPQEFLSVQNHPDDDYAQKHEGVPYGKSEAWLVLQAEPGTKLIHGLKRAVTRDELRSAMHNNALMPLCEYVPAKAGDVFINTPGMIHALGTGIVIYEVQQSSDVTYRLYDWDRKPAPGEPVRELHIDKGADVADLRPIQPHKITPVVLHEAGVTRTVLVACRYYASETLELHAQTTQHTAGRSFHPAQSYLRQYGPRSMCVRSRPAEVHCSSHPQVLHRVSQRNESLEFSFVCR